MPICYHCERKISELPYRCKFCGMIFCKNHRLPENHVCPFDLRGKQGNNRIFIKYQDTLEFLEKELTVGKIYDYVTTNQMSKTEATDLLAYFIENSDNSEIRTVSIQAFKVLDLKSDRAFHVLESCLVSEEDPNIKEILTETISILFPRKIKALLDLMSKN